MTVQFTKREVSKASPVATDCSGSDTPSKREPRHQHGGAKPLSVVNISLSQPGILRVGHLLTFLTISSTELYKRRKTGLIPPPSGNDGRPYWTTEVVRKLLDSLNGSQS